MAEIGKTIEDASIEELEAELNRRLLFKPTPLQNPSFHEVSKSVIELVTVIDGGGSRNDYEQYIFQVAVEAVYGKSIWTWWNSKHP